MEYLVNGIKNFFVSSQEQEIVEKPTIEIPNNYSKEMTAYILDESNPNRIHILAKETDIYWRTYFVDKDVKIIQPTASIRSVFCP
jgi:hypothetical protein